MRLEDHILYRVDVDDRDLKVGKKIREAEKEWIPYALVIGEKELSGGTLTVRPRFGEQFEMTLEEFLERLAADTAGKPALPANTPLLLSRRPVFMRQGISRINTPRDKPKCSRAFLIRPDISIRSVFPHAGRHAKILKHFCDAIPGRHKNKNSLTLSLRFPHGKLNRIKR